MECTENSKAPLSSLKFKICECGLIFEDEFYLKEHLKRKHRGETKIVKHISWPKLPSPKSAQTTIQTKQEDESDSHSPGVQDSEDTTVDSEVLRIPWTALRKSDLKEVPKTMYKKARIVFEDVKQEPIAELNSLHEEEIDSKDNIINSVDVSNNQTNTEEGSDEEYMICQKVGKDGSIEFKKMVGKISQNDLPPNQCSKCYRIFADQKIRLQHEKVKHGAGRPTKVGESRKSKLQGEKIECEICGKHRHPLSMKAHMMIHTGEKPYQCEYCSKGFSLKCNLVTHRRRHTGERPFQCPICQRRFPSVQGLYRHKMVHTGTKPYVCPQCGKAFSQSNGMKLHLKCVHFKQPDPYRRTRIESKKTRRPRDSDGNYSFVSRVLPVEFITATSVEENVAQNASTHVNIPEKPIEYEKVDEYAEWDGHAEPERTNIVPELNSPDAFETGPVASYETVVETAVDETLLSDVTDTSPDYQEDDTVDLIRPEHAFINPIPNSPMKRIFLTKTLKNVASPIVISRGVILTEPVQNIDDSGQYILQNSSENDHINRTEPISKPRKKIVVKTIRANVVPYRRNRAVAGVKTPNIIRSKAKTAEIVSKVSKANTVAVVNSKINLPVIRLNPNNSVTYRSMPSLNVGMLNVAEPSPSVFPQSITLEQLKNSVIVKRLT